jgi:hypothetical protein
MSRYARLRGYQGRPLISIIDEWQDVFACAGACGEAARGEVREMLLQYLMR